MFALFIDEPVFWHDQLYWVEHPPRGVWIAESRQLPFYWGAVFGESFDDTKRFLWTLQHWPVHHPEQIPVVDFNGNPAGPYVEQVWAFRDISSSSVERYL